MFCFTVSVRLAGSSSRLGQPSGTGLIWHTSVLPVSDAAAAQQRPSRSPRCFARRLGSSPLDSPRFAPRRLGSSSPDSPGLRSAAAPLRLACHLCVAQRLHCALLDSTRFAPRGLRSAAAPLRSTYRRGSSAATTRQRQSTDRSSARSTPLFGLRLRWLRSTLLLGAFARRPPTSSARLSNPAVSAALNCFASSKAARGSLGGLSGLARPPPHPVFVSLKLPLSGLCSWATLCRSALLPVAGCYFVRFLCLD